MLMFCRKRTPLNVQLFYSTSRSCFIEDLSHLISPFMAQGRAVADMMQKTTVTANSFWLFPYTRFTINLENYMFGHIVSANSVWWMSHVTQPESDWNVKPAPRPPLKAPSLLLESEKSATAVISLQSSWNKTQFQTTGKNLSTGSCRAMSVAFYDLSRKFWRWKCNLLHLLFCSNYPDPQLKTS